MCEMLLDRPDPYRERERAGPMLWVRLAEFIPTKEGLAVRRGDAASSMHLRPASRLVARQW